MRIMRFGQLTLVCVWLVSVAVGNLSGATQERYVRAFADAAGNLAIVTQDGRTITIPRESGQVGFDDIEISPAGDAVGWVGIRENCCTSYNIPTGLYVYTAGTVRRHDGVGLPVWKWMFSRDGKYFSFHQETVHGGIGTHYELRAVSSGTLIAEYTPAVSRDNRPLSNQQVPAWVTELEAKR